VAGRNHGDARRIERELREIGDGGQGKTDVMHRATGRHQT
jgi:hypothetical protein